MSHPLSKILLAQGDALSLPLPADSVHVIVTSPPYWALRDYEVGEDAGELGSELVPDCWRWTFNNAFSEPVAGCCHVCNMRLVLRELMRVLHPSGTVWFNYGHMFAQDAPRGRYGDQGDLSTGDHGELGPRRSMADLAKLGVKKGDQVLMLERLTLAFQRDGWYVRTKIIWSKPNAMPGPAQCWRRPIDSYETVLLLAKDWRYYYDAEAIREEPANYTRKGGHATYTANTPGIHHGEGSTSLHQMAPNGRHKRDVWTIPTKGWKGAHFACYPPALVRPCILAGTSEVGVCPSCGWPWRRQLEKRGDVWVTIGWLRPCDCPLRRPVPAIALDPFIGSGTTSEVARELGRLSIGIDISHQYLVEEAYDRLGVSAWRQFYHGKAAPAVANVADLPLFQKEELIING